MRVGWPFWGVVWILGFSQLVGQLDRDSFTIFPNFTALQKAAEEVKWEGIMDDGETQSLRRAKFITIAIDGGAGSGKTSTAKAIAKANGFAFVSTGKHYRTLAHYLLKQKISPADGPEMQKFLDNLHPTTLLVDGEAHLSLNGTLLPDEILRRSEINGLVSDYASLGSIRQFCIQYQKTLPRVALSAGFPGLVAEGRDMTSAVFPHASLRVYLEANEEERSRRRINQGEWDNVGERDRKDRQQLQWTDGVWLIDSTQLSLERVVALLQSEINGLLP
jgi:cytidylate kinase